MQGLTGGVRQTRRRCTIYCFLHTTRDQEKPDEHTASQGINEEGVRFPQGRRRQGAGARQIRWQGKHEDRSEARGSVEVEGRAARGTEDQGTLFGAEERDESRCQGSRRKERREGHRCRSRGDKTAKTQAKPEAKTKYAKKEKVVRDSFTMPKSDYAKIAALKEKCQKNGMRVKKSELLRAALVLLDSAPERLVVENTVKALETVKTGRPANA